ncbi:MAG: KEOPS complex kinase/ATPase Bud32 [Candidatus Thorarchaeota archaeon]|jgi:TP53 regulating kinase-like protein
MKIVGRGAEALLIYEDDVLIKRRIKKSYRLKEIDEKLRKLRTRSEFKIMDKLKGEIHVPKILKVDEKTREIGMEFIAGEKLSDKLDSYSLTKQKQILSQIGQQTGKLHDLDIIHSDLTTSNMILKQNKVYFIDFGLSFHSTRIEDKAVDLHLLRQALEAKHFTNWQELFQSFISGYKPQRRTDILNQLKKVEARGRYKDKSC